MKPDLRPCFPAVLILATALHLSAQPAAQPLPGQRVYEQHCAACHGANGDGNGPAAKQQVWVRLEGVLSTLDAEGLSERISETLARSRSRLILDLNKLHWDKVQDLRPLREKLAAHRSRIRLVLPKLSATHPEFLLLASLFQHYQH